MGLNFQKLDSPFIREIVNKEFVCVPKINDRFRWAFDSEKVTAVEKLNGTNVSIIIAGGEVRTIFNRLNYVPLFRKGSFRFYEGIQNAIDRGYVYLDVDGQFFGELCGPNVNGNPLKLKKHIWFPFSLLLNRNKYNFWNKLCEEELKDKSDLEIYEVVSNVFKGLWSLEHRRRDRKEMAEGIVFYKLDEEGNIKGRCKLRRDMFD